MYKKTDYAELINSLQDAIILIHPRDEIILDINKAASELFNYEPKELIGKGLAELSIDIEFERQQLNRTLINKSHNCFETSRLTSNDKNIRLEVISSKINYNNSEAIMQLCKDISKDKTEKIDFLKKEIEYRSIYDNHPLILVVTNLNKTILSINKNGAKELGYSTEDLIGTEITSLFIEQESERLDKQIQNVLLNFGKPSSHEMKMLRKNNSEFWVRETLYSTDGSNSEKRIFFVCDNITYQKNAEAEAKNLARSLQNMLDASPLGVLVYRLDDNDELIFISTNQSAIDIMKIDLYKLISKKIQNIFPGFIDIGLIDKLKIIISTGKSLNNQIVNYKDEHLNGVFEISAIRLTENTVAIFFADITEKQKAITALTESEIKHKTLFESANDAIFLMKNDVFIDCNLKTLETFGCKRDEIIGKSLKDFSSETQSDGENSLTSATRKIDLALNNIPQFFEWTHKKLNGDLFFAEVSLKKIEFQNEIFIQAIVRDITERKKSEKIISDQRRELSTLMSNLPGMAYRCANNFNWTMQFVSEGCYELTGYKPEELVNDSVISYANLIHKDDQLNVRENVQQALLNEEHFTLLYRIITASNQEKWVWEKGRGTKDENGNLVYLEGFVTDITERKSAEEQIQILAHALKSVTECVCITDLKERIKFINKSFSRVYGFEPEELIGKHISVLRSEKNDPEILRKILPETLAGGWTGNLINVNKFGEEIPIRLSTSLIINDEGRPIAMAGVIVDVTDLLKKEKELRNAKERAEEASKLKTNFLATISHELRTPLVSILGFAEIIKDDVEQPEISNMAQLILTSGKRLLETLNSVLDLSKIETNNLKLNYTNINISDFILEHIKFFEKSAENKGLSLLIELKEKNIFARLDDQILFQIMNNLIGNAIKYTDKGSVKVVVDKEINLNKHYVVIKVIDTGIGISKENLTQIFEEFRQVSEGLNRQFEGTGLGLTITKRFIKIMNGNIFVESEPGIGSTFKILFDVVDNRDKIIESRKEVEILDKIEDTFELTVLPEVLMVENDFASRKITELFLRNICKITFTESGEEALNLVREKTFKLILMDINLGRGLSGLDTAKLIRRIKGYEQIPIIALTAFAMAGEKEEFLRNGCSHYLSKPFQKKELVGLIQELI